MKKRGRQPSRLPRRYRKGGKEVGSFYVRIQGRDVNLRTVDANEAMRRTRQAFQGKRDFAPDDSGKRAAKAITRPAGTGDATTPPVVDPPAAPAPGLPAQASSLSAPAPVPPVHTPPAALPPIPPASSAPSSSSSSSPPGPTPVTPDGYIPPRAGWAEAVRGAAAAAGASSASEAGEGEEEDEDGKITPEMLEEWLDDVANGAVQLQLLGQEWLLAHAKPVIGVNVKAAPVPDGAKGRLVGRKIWKRCFRKLIARYMPNLDIPDWIAAPVMIASMTLPVQAFSEGAQVMPDDGATKKETTPGGEAPATAAA